MITYSNANEKLMNARCRLLTREPFYGSFAMGLVYHPYEFPGTPEEAKTMAVRMMSNGNIDMVYYPPFIDRLTTEECYGVLMHEIEHVIRLHCLRGVTLHQQLYNIAADMTVNGQKKNPRVGYPSTSQGGGEYGGRTLPDMDKLVWIPDDWPPNASAEEYYKLLIDSAEQCPVHGAKSKGGKSAEQDDKGEGSGCTEGDKSKSSKGKKCTCQYGSLLDNHDVWQQSDMSQDEARQIVKEMTNQAINRNQGKYPGHLAEAIKQLATPKVRWRELLRRYLGQHVGNKRFTYSRRNRRSDEFGVKGVSHHAAATVNVIIDTSGSISSDELSKFFAEIDAISSRAMVNILQWDYNFQGFGKYRRGDWKKFKVNGRGGTDMAAPYQWLEDNAKVADVQVMLTDGYTNWATPRAYPSIVIVTTNQPGPTWGHVIHLDDGIK